MKTTELYTQEQNMETATFNNFQNQSLTVEELLKVRGGNSDSDDDDDEDNGSTSNKQEDGFN